LDHNDPGKGTFSQRYWWDATHYKGPGSPIFLFNVGESAADNFLGYLEGGTISGKYAEVFDGAVIVIERMSMPFPCSLYSLLMHFSQIDTGASPSHSTS
jgi:hypothetical protein